MDSTLTPDKALQRTEYEQSAINAAAVCHRWGKTFEVMRFGLPILASLVIFQHAYADADSEDDAAQPEAILNALLAAQYPAAADHLSGVVFGDLDADGRPDAVVTYSHGSGAEGGNQYSQRAALFLSVDGRWVLAHHLKVGTKGIRFLKPTTISDGTVEFSVNFWQATDNACCPTGESTTRFIVRDDKMQEL